jgi:peroxin-1
MKKDTPLLSLSPFHVKKFRKNKAIEKNGLEVLDSQHSREVKNMLLKSGLGTPVDHVDRSTHDEVIAALSYESPCEEDGEAACKSDGGKGLQSLLRAWFLAQVDAIASNVGAEVSSLLLGNETLLHYEVKCFKRGTHGKVQASSIGSLEDRNKTTELPIDVSYLLIISDESLQGGRVNAYEIAFDQRNNSLECALENLNLANPVSFYSVQERTSDKEDLSSLSWKGKTASDVMNSRYFPLEII